MCAKLKEYNKKRSFDKTSEPKGQREHSHASLRFVVQHHWARREHYDFRLEWNGALLSWAIPKGPSYNMRDKRLAVHVEDHPLEYRNFEGTIPKGEYGGGVVMLWDEGTWEPASDVAVGLREGALKFILSGKRLNGKWTLVRLKETPTEPQNNWLLIKENDQYVKKTSGISRFTTSIRTGRSMAEIQGETAQASAKNPFDKTSVQLAKLVDAVPKNGDWLYELKYDGYRMLAFIETQTVRLITRNGNDYTHRFRGIAASILEWAAGETMVLDGEMVITDAKGKTDFQALQNYMRNPAGKQPTYIVFDLLALNGTDLRSRRLYERKETLQQLLRSAPATLYYSKHLHGNGNASFKAACKAGLEGIIGKKADSIYSGTRNGDWIKLKCEKRQEFVVGGYTLTEKKTSGVSSLLLGVYAGNQLVYAGRAGSGITQDEMKELEAKFKHLMRPTSPFLRYQKPRQKETVTWLEPKLVAEIKFAEWTKDNLLRHASYKGLRTDKDPKRVKKETPT